MKHEKLIYGWQCTLGHSISLSLYRIKNKLFGPAEVLLGVATRILQIICSGAEIFKRQYDMKVGFMAHPLV